MAMMAAALERCGSFLFHRKFLRISYEIKKPFGGYACARSSGGTAPTMHLKGSKVHAPFAPIAKMS